MGSSTETLSSVELLTRSLACSVSLKHFKYPILPLRVLSGLLRVSTHSLGSTGLIKASVRGWSPVWVVF